MMGVLMKRHLTLIRDIFQHLHLVPMHLVLALADEVALPALDAVELSAGTMLA